MLLTHSTSFPNFVVTMKSFRISTTALLSETFIAIRHKSCLTGHFWRKTYIRSVKCIGKPKKSRTTSQIVVQCLVKCRSWKLGPGNCVQTFLAQNLKKLIQIALTQKSPIPTGHIFWTRSRISCTWKTNVETDAGICKPRGKTVSIPESTGGQLLILN